MQELIRNIINLNSVTSREVVQDEIKITLEVTEQAAAANTVQQALLKSLEKATRLANTASTSNEELNVETGTFSISPMFAKDDSITGYTGTAQLILRGTNIAAISALAPDIQSMSVTSITYSISRATRIALESEVSAEAIQAFLVRADQYSRDFRYDGFSLINANVNVNFQSQSPYDGAMAMSLAVGSAPGSAPIPTSPGKEQLTATVQGSIQLETKPFDKKA